MVKRVKFGSLKIQKLNRVALPNSLLENLDLSEGKDIEVFLDVEKEEIIIKKPKTRK
jgi:antitoxin component of MazEF toxin-antitoxin module